MQDLQEAAVEAANLATATDVETAGGGVETEVGGLSGGSDIGQIDSLVSQLVTERRNRDNAVKAGVQAIDGADSGGRSSAAYSAAKNDYVAAGGDANSFDAMVGAAGKNGEHKDYFNESGEVVSGTFPGGSVSITGGWNANGLGTHDDNIVVTFPDGTTVTGLSVLNENLIKKKEHPSIAKGGLKDALNKLSGDDKTPGDKWLALYNGVPYVHKAGEWVAFDNNPSSGTDTGYKDLANKMKIQLNKYETGGLADFTGPAWLDGTPSKPEYILNAAQTERFFSLVDVLEGYDSSRNGNQQDKGDNYFEIEINVEKIDNDYDVEKMANKIRDMIYQDATYRNVNAINHIR